MKFKVVRVMALIFVCLSQGCAPTNFELAYEAHSKGDIATAVHYYNACLAYDRGFSSQGYCANNMGILYWNLGERDKAINFWYYAARQDNSHARNNLLNLAGQQPPPVDPQILYQRQRAMESMSKAARSTGALIGGSIAR